MQYQWLKYIFILLYNDYLGKSKMGRKILNNSSAESMNAMILLM